MIFFKNGFLELLAPIEGKEEYYQVFKSIYPFIFPFHRLYKLYICMHYFLEKPCLIYR